MTASNSTGGQFVQESYKDIKQSWITKQMMHREKEFTDYTSLK